MTRIAQTTSLPRRATSLPRRATFLPRRATFLQRLATLLTLLAGTPSLAPAADTSPAAGGKAARDPAQIFATACGWCHYKAGREAGKGPQLMGTTLTDEQIALRIRKGRQGFMPGFESSFSDQEIAALVGYIRALKPG